MFKNANDHEVVQQVALCYLQVLSVHDVFGSIEVLVSLEGGPIVRELIDGGVVVDVPRSGGFVSKLEKPFLEGEIGSIEVAVVPRAVS